MAKSPAQAPVGMEKAELRTHVKFARRQPVHIAFALGGDGKAIVLMDKRKQPRAVLKELKEQAADARNHRFGQMMFDPENPKLARITVDKASSGMARKLVVAFKGTGVRQIQLMTEDGQAFDSAVNEEDEEEGEGEEDAGSEIANGFSDMATGMADAAHGIGDAISGLFGEDDGEGEHHRHRHHHRHRPEREEGADAQWQSDAEAPAADASSTGSDDATQTVDADSTQDGPAAANQQYDANALKDDLVGLVKRMMGAIKNDPSQKAGLAELATDAQAALKRGDLAQASAGMDVFRQALDAVENPDAGNTADAGDSSADTSGSNDPKAAGASTDDATSTNMAGPDTPTADADSGPTDASSDGAADGSQAPAGPGAQAVQRYRKSRAVWQATRSKIDADIKKLSDTILKMDHGGKLGDNLEQDFLKTIDPILSTLDDSLADILSTAEKAKSQDEASEALDQARTTIKLYQNFVSSNDTIQELDKNPFMPMAIAKTLNASLQVLSAAMK